MKRFAQFLIVCVLTAESMYAVCKSEACKRATAWKNGYTAIVLEEDLPRDDYFAVLNTIKANGGAIAVEAERVLLGWVPRSAAGKIQAARGVRAVLYDPAARPRDFSRREDEVSALAFFNRVVRGEYEDAIEEGLTRSGEPLVGCVLPKATMTSRTTVPSEATTAVQTDGHAGVQPNFDYRMPYQNPDMRGRVTVQLFRLDSNGSIDPNVYTWAWADFTFARDQVLGAFSFWVNEATARGISLSFRVATSDPYSRLNRAYVPTPVQYEPITRNQADFYLYVNDALALHGYGSSSPFTREDVLERSEDFNRDKKADPYIGPFDRSFSVYIIYNPGSARSVFADGKRAFAQYDGPMTLIMWNTAGWGSSNLGRVLTHETGHIFWACDEYHDAPSNTGCTTCNHCLYNVGPRNQVATPSIRNANCDYADPNSICDLLRTSCVMKQIDYVLCPHTPAQLGW